MNPTKAMHSTKAMKACLAALLLVPALGLAQEPAGASPKTFFFEARVGAYTPRIDQVEVFSVSKPYESTFGKSFMWLGEAELDVQFFQRFGSLGLGLSVGYAEKYGKALVSATGGASSQSTSLHVLPIKALLVYRFDWLNLRFGIPLVPYLKGGALLMPWWINKGTNLETVTVGAETFKAVGYKPGLVGTVGLSLCLDFLDRRMARDFDSGVGVNHSYLFAEYTLQDTLLFEAKKATALDLSGAYPVFGLGLEF